MESPKVEAWSLPSQQESMPKVDLRTDIAHSARVYDYMLGGKTNFPADREAGDRILAEWPEARDSARAARAVMHRMVHRLAEVHGIRQFLDIGTGIPTAPNVHEIVQAVEPSSRVVYVDNDPIVLAHARALLSSTPEGRTAYVEGDLRDPDAILADVEKRGTLDFTRPVALTLINLVHFYSDEAVQELVPRLLAPLAPGSFLALTAGTADAAPKRAEIASRRYTEAGIENHLRTRVQVERFFRGLELDEPGVALINHWHPDVDDETVLPDDETMAYAGIGRKA
ncbi:SAM-dependent methyltransferase [Streptacidiphilus sp. BW17]|uniref:SAM-dependent methyltransferase n=1 Tax=Streptacidiphilus sp. BW17 TaxID=3156274 RepID=UPI0035177D80